jgi:hypothetical protein
MDGVFALDTATKWTSGRVRGFNSRLPKFEQKPLEDDYASLSDFDIFREFRRRENQYVWPSLGVILFRSTSDVS